MNPNEIAKTLMWEFYGDASKARAYAQQIAAFNGPLQKEYSGAATVLGACEPKYTQEQAETMHAALEQILETQDSIECGVMAARALAAVKYGEPKE